jgi:hypothetical protein
VTLRLRSTGGIARRCLFSAVLAGVSLPRKLRASPVVVDRAVVRFSAPEIGGVRAPAFILERELAFEARLEALGDDTFRVRPEQPYRDRHVSRALEQHIAEVLLAGLRIVPEPSRETLDRQTRAARLLLTQSLGDAGALWEAQLSEGIGVAELSRLLRRKARASLYLHTMVAPMLEPSDSELRLAQRMAPEPLKSQAYQVAREGLKAWAVKRRLSIAAGAFYRNARARLQVTFL